MSRLRNSIIDLLEDLSTVEAVITDEKNTLLTYGRIEVEGDSINYLDKDKCTPEVAILHRKSLETCIRARRALWNMASNIF